MGENEIAEDGNHEGVGATFGEELVDPELKTAVQSELSGKDFVLGEDQEEYAYADTKKRQSSEVPGIRREWHAGIIMKSVRRGLGKNEEAGSCQFLEGWGRVWVPALGAGKSESRSIRRNSQESLRAPARLVGLLHYAHIVHTGADRKS